MFKKYILALSVMLSGLLFTGCGDPDVEITGSSNYEPKIVVDAYLYANEPVGNIRISRNFAIGVPVDVHTMILSPAANNVVVAINGTPLTFDPATGLYGNPAMVVECGKTYTLQVSATVNGKQLSASSVTTVPAAGFKILGSRYLGDKVYLQDSVILNYTPSEKSDIYVFTSIAKQASMESYIMDNPYEVKVDTVELRKNLDDLKTQYEAFINLNSQFNGEFTFKLPFFRTRFYGQYKILGYAGDINFKNYLLSAAEVQEQDGNFHEPVQIFTGDAIGVFASAVKDTVAFNLIK